MPTGLRAIRAAKVPQPVPAPNHSPSLPRGASACSGGNTASWDQAGAGAWNAFVALVPALQQQPAGKLPLVRMVGTKSVKFQRGSTVEPVLEVVQWVDRPDCLKEGAAAGIATDPAPAAAPAPAPAVTPAAQATIPQGAAF